MRLVIVIGGPIASGKSTLATSVARVFESRALAVATIDLDLIYEMLEHARAPKSDSAIWSRARRTAGALADALFVDGIDVVIAEGDFLDDSARQEFISALRDDLPVRFVTLNVDLETALLRVDQDPTRGLSRDRSFLTRHYEQLAETLQRRPEHDLCLDMGTLTIEQAAESVLQWSIGSAASG
jgi:predicted kinase